MNLWYEAVNTRLCEINNSKNLLQLSHSSVLYIENFNFYWKNYEIILYNRIMDHKQCSSTRYIVYLFNNWLFVQFLGWKQFDKKWSYFQSGQMETIEALFNIQMELLLLCLCNDYTRHHLKAGREKSVKGGNLWIYITWRLRVQLLQGWAISNQSVSGK